MISAAECGEEPGVMGVVDQSEDAVARTLIAGSEEYPSERIPTVGQPVDNMGCHANVHRLCGIRITCL